MPLNNLCGVYARTAVQFQPGLVTRLMEMPLHPVAVLVREFQRRPHSERDQPRICPRPDAPDVGKVGQRERLPPFLVRVNHAHAAVPAKFLREFASDFRQCFRRGNANAYRNVCVQCYFPYHSAHEFHDVEMFFVAVQIEELFVNGVAFGVLYCLPHDALHALRHCRIQYEVAGEYGDIVLPDDVLYFEEWCSALDSQCLGFRRKGNDISVIVRQYAYGFSLETRVEGPFYRCKECVAVRECYHIFRMFLVMRRFPALARLLRYPHPKSLPSG